MTVETRVPVAVVVMMECVVIVMAVVVPVASVVVVVAWKRIARYPLECTATWIR